MKWRRRGLEKEVGRGTVLEDEKRGGGSRTEERGDREGERVRGGGKEEA